MATSSYDDQGIRFVYPVGWEIDVTDGGAVSTVTVQSPDGPSFLFVTLDATRPEPKFIADQALEAMREEYPTLEAIAIGELIDGHPAYGHDIDFMSLDMANSCAIRCYRTPNRTVLFFGQWSDLESDTAEDVMLAIRRSIEETDSANR